MDKRELATLRARRCPAAQCRQRLMGPHARKACGSFVLMVAGELPGDHEVEESCSLEEVFGWFRDCPEQIERTGTALRLNGR